MSQKNQLNHKHPKYNNNLISIFHKIQQSFISLESHVNHKQIDIFPISLKNCHLKSTDKSKIKFNSSLLCFLRRILTGNNPFICHGYFNWHFQKHWVSFRRKFSLLSKYSINRKTQFNTWIIYYPFFVSILQQNTSSLIIFQLTKINSNQLYKLLYLQCYQTIDILINGNKFWLEIKHAVTDDFSSTANLIFPDQSLSILSKFVG